MLQRPFDVREVPFQEFRNDTVRGETIVGQNFQHHRYFGRTFVDCTFSRCDFTDLRTWDNRLERVRFIECDLRQASLGGADRSYNRFYHVTFEQCDMRGTCYKFAEFIECAFEESRLDKVNFQGSRFVRSRFSGKLRETMFYDCGFRGEHFPRNELETCDFSRAVFEWTEFRRLNLDSIVPPSTDRHFLVRHYQRFLKLAPSHLAPEETELRSALEFRRKWCGSQQELGIFGHFELQRIIGKDWRTRFECLLQSTSA